MRVIEERALIDELLDRLPLGVVVLDAEGLVEQANSRARDILGVDPGAARWRLADRFEPSERARVEGVLGGTAALPCVLARRDGTAGDRHVEVGSRTTMGPRTIVLLEDVTERLEADRSQHDASLRLAFLAEASAVLGSSLDPDETLRNLARLAVPFLADWCNVYMLGPDGGIRRVSMEHREPGWADLAAEVRRRFRLEVDTDEGVPKVLRTGAPELHPHADAALLSADVDDPEGMRALLEPLGITSWLCVPVRSQDRVLGAISFVAAGSGRRYGPDDLTLAEELARRAALAIENSRLFDEAQRAVRAREEALRLRDQLLLREQEARAEAEDTARRLRRLQAVTDVALSHLGTDDLMQELLVRIRDMWRADTVSILLVTPDGSGLVPRASLGLEEEVERGAPVPMGRGVAGRIAATGEPLVVEDLTKTRFAPGVLRERGISSLMGVPLWARGRVIGVVHVGTARRYSFTPEDVRLLRLVADRCALAIEQSRLFESEQHAREEAEHSAALVSRLQAVTSALSEAVTPTQVATVTIQHVLGATDAVAGALLLVSGDHLEPLHGQDGGTVEPWSSFPLAIDVPVCVTARTGEPVFLGSIEERDERFPLMALFPTKHQALATVPLALEGRTIGVMALSYATPRIFDADDRDFLLAVGQQCVQAFERARLYEAEQEARAAAEEAEDRLAVLDEAGTILAAALGYRERLGALARFTVPRLADACSIHVVSDDGTLRMVASAATGEDRAWIERFVERYPPDLSGDQGIAQVIRTGQSALYASVTDDILRETARDDEHLAFLRTLPFRSTIIVPLVARDRVLGAMSLLTTATSGRRYGEADHTLAQELARRAAHAIDTAQLYRQAQVAEERFRTIVNGVDAIVWEAEPDPFRFTFVSTKLQDILGYPPERWLAEPSLWGEVVPPEDRRRVIGIYRSAAERDWTQPLEYRLRARDGRTIWVQDMVHTERDADGSPRSLRGLIVDITRRKQEERHQLARHAAVRVLAETESLAELAPLLLRAICEALEWDVGALWTLDDGENTLRCVDFWHAAGVAVPRFEDVTRSFRFPPGVGLPGRVWQLGQPAWIADVVADPNFPRAAAAEADGLHGAFSFPIVIGGRTQGAVEFFKREYAPVEPDLLATMATVGSQLGQVIERRQTEDARRQTEARTRAILASAMDAVVSIDDEGTVVEFNPAAERIFGFTRDEVIGRSLIDTLVPERFREAITEARRRHAETGFEAIIGRRTETVARRKDGTEFPIEASVVRVETIPPLFTGYVRDISDRKIAERRRAVSLAATRVLAAAATVPEAAAGMVQSLGEALDAAAALFWEVDPRGPIVLRAAWSRPSAELRAFVEASERMRFEPGRGWPGGMWSSARPAWIADIARGSGLQRVEDAARAGLRACIGFPVLGDGETLGAVELWMARVEEPDPDLLELLDEVGKDLGQFVGRRRVEGELLYRTALLDATSEATIDGIVVIAPDRSVLSHNRRFLEMWQITDETIATMDDRAILDSVLHMLADPERFRERVEHLYEHPDEESREEVLLVDGRIFDRWSAPLRAADGTHYGRAWYFRDISERKRIERALQDSTERLAFLAEASSILASSLVHTVALQSLARLAVPYLADWCVVDVTEPDGRVHRVAVEHPDPAKRDLASRIALHAHYEVDPAAERGVPRVLRTGEPEIEADIPDAWLERAAGDDQTYLGLLREMGFVSYMCVPLIARGRILGAITFVTAESGRRYGAADMALAQDLARRTALAVDNARLYAEQTHIARTLQDSLLPPRLPEIPDVDVEARYHFAGEGTQVGGDFYDVFEASGRDWAIVMGDVCGKGAEAAATTALARYTIRTSALQARKPSRILQTLNDAIMHHGFESRYCTVAYARLRPMGEGLFRVTTACGGHPLPLIVRAGGRVENAGRPGTLLGMFPDPDLTDHATQLRPGDALVIYTDGVTEARDSEGRVFGEEQLRELLASSAGQSAGTIADRILDAVLEYGAGAPRDDIALVVLAPRPALDQPQDGTA